MLQQHVWSERTFLFRCAPVASVYSTSLQILVRCEHLVTHYLNDNDLSSCRARFRGSLRHALAATNRH